MMYGTITPEYKVKTTISHPLRPEWVIGFEARNTALGWRAILMKDEAVEDGRVIIPAKSTGGLLDGSGELAVLQGEQVYTMKGAEFEDEYSMHTLCRDDDKATVNYVPIESEKFETWDKSHVPIGSE
jgi:hypothetical protein